MAKQKKKIKKKTVIQQPVKQVDKKDWLELFEQRRFMIGYFVIVFIFLLFFYKPLVFDGLEANGADVVSNIGISHQVKQFMEDGGERALWNPYMFAGMPTYHRHGGITWSVDTFVNVLDSAIDWRIWYFMIGVIGMFFLAKYLGLSAITGIVAGICFILIPHFQSLIVVGHFSKFRALMWLPFLLLSFLSFINRRNLLSMLLFVLVFSLFMRTQHYQIIFYGVLLLFFCGIVPYIKIVLEKHWNEFLKFNGLFVCSLVLVVIIVAQPLFVTGDYTPYSTRGGNAISLEKDVTDQDKKGVGFDYATNWSYSFSEFWNLVIPKFHGGTSQEIYKGSKVPQLRNQVIPSYWGDLPFTQSYEYMGVIIVFLALVGIVFQWRRIEVKSLTILTLFALFLSLGKNFSILYKPLFYYFPYFDKFRVPMMILTLVSFNTIILAAFGLNYLLGKDFEKKENQKKMFRMGGIFVFLLILPLLIGSNLSLSPQQEETKFAAQYGPEQGKQIINLLKEARLDILKTSTIRTIFVMIAGLVCFYLFSRKWLSKHSLAVCLLLIAGLDLGLISKEYLDGKFVDPQRIENQVYRENNIDRLIKSDKSLYRVLPPLQIVGNNSRWSYHHQSIGGYSPAKPQGIQDILTNNLTKGPDPTLPLNLNIVSMLNGKYIVASYKGSHPQLELLGENEAEKLYLFQNKSNLPRSFFVDNIRVITDGEERLNFMNSYEFDPGHIALLEEELVQPVSSPDSSFSRVIHFEPNNMTIEAFTDKNALLVVSEIYYPKGWQAFLDDDEELRIYKTNHLLRSVIVPEGLHTIKFVFKPQVYYSGVYISLVGILVVYLGIFFFSYKEYGHKLKNLFSKSP